MLLLAGIQSAPWSGVGPVAIVWGLLGLGRIVYEVVVARRVRSQSVYAPVFEDRLFHVLLPFVAYAAIAASAFMARSNVAESLYVMAAAVLLLLFVGIHNAWDAVTYHVFSKRAGAEKTEEKMND